MGIIGAKGKKVSEIITDKAVLKVAVPTNNEKSALAAEQMFQSIHGILKGKKKSTDHISFEIVGTRTGIYFLVICNKRYTDFIQNQIYAQYPTANISLVDDYAFGLDGLKPDMKVVSKEITLEKSFYLPIKTFVSFEVDPLASITGSIAKLPENYQAWIQVVFRPISNSWQKTGKNYVDNQKNKLDSEGHKVSLESGGSEELKEIERKNTKVGFQFLIRVITIGKDELEAQKVVDDIIASFKQFQTPHLNSLTLKPEQKSLSDHLKKVLFRNRLEYKLSPLDKYFYRYLPENNKTILNTEELASVVHLPSISVETPNIAWSRSKKLPFPNNIPTQDARLFAFTDYRNIHIPFGVKQLDRRRHMYVLGKTGSGKTTLMKNMIVEDIIAGKGVGVIDPHGDLIEELLDLIPESRAKDVVLIDPSDVDFPVGLNMLDLKPGETKELLADGIVSVFEKYFGESWGPRLHYILLNIILTLLNCQNVSLMAVPRILVDKNYRKFLLKQVKDPFLLQFWEQEFAALDQNKKMLTEAISPIQNKVGRFLNSPMVRNMFGQVKSTIDLSEIMNEGKILLVNLSQGKIGEENSSLLGGMIVTRLYTNAMQRANISQEQRKDFYLYVDEFQNFATTTFVKILSEARKYGLNLIVTHQYIDQISEEIQKAIFGNVGTLMNYVVGQRDAQFLSEEYSPFFEPSDLVNLGKFRLIVKVMIDGNQSNPFTAIAMPPSTKYAGYREAIRNKSRESYAKKREDIEAKLYKWSLQKYNDQGNVIQQPGSESPS